jgi:putative inorganic carbon (HCO3(-)) transporter
LFSKLKKTLLVFLVSVVALTFLIPATRQRLIPVFTGKDPAGQQRILLYEGAWKIIRVQPVLGAGLMGYRDWYGALRASQRDEILNYPHNFFLNFWVETGLFGLLSVLGMLSWTLVAAVRIYRAKPQNQALVLAVLAAWLALLVHGQFDAPFFKNDLAIFFWFLLAAIPVLACLSETKPGH